jgi:hypothetical protein
MAWSALGGLHLLPKEAPAGAFFKYFVTENRTQHHDRQIESKSYEAAHDATDVDRSSFWAKLSEKHARSMAGEHEDPPAKRERKVKKRKGEETKNPTEPS